MSSPLLEVKDLQVIVGEEQKVLLDGLNLTVNAGETHVLMGHNGAGKSTLMSALMGDPRYTVTRGQILFRGQDVTHETADVRARAGMFLSFQTPEEIPGITLESFLRTAAGAVAGKPVKVMKFRHEMAAQMEALNMDPSYADRYLNVGFSGGEKKKAEILQLLMLKPSLALLDETDSGLDVDAVKTVASGIKAYHNADNALIIITHNAKILEGLQVDYVHVLDDARIVRTGDGSLVNEIIEEGFTALKEDEAKSRAFETEKTEIAEVDRSVYDIKDKVNAAFEVNSGLTAEIVEKISEEKHDPEWMREFRLKALDTYNRMSLPTWGPSLEGLDMSNIVTYVRPNTEMRGKWSEVPDDIKNTFERLGIPQAERSSLAGVGAQYDSEVVYHNVKEEVAAQGVIYTDMESALTGPYADMVKEHFMKCVPPTDHKFAALHGAVWSGGSFVYVPAGVHVDIPLQSYFRLNAPGAGQFEHTLIIVDKGAYLHFIEGCSAPKYNVANLHAGCVEIFVGEGARVRYSTIENWSKNMYNLNTKRAQRGKRRHDRVGIRFLRLPHGLPVPDERADRARVPAWSSPASPLRVPGQDLDTGAKVVHAAPNTTSHISTKSHRPATAASPTSAPPLWCCPTLQGSKSSVSCESLMLDDRMSAPTRSPPWTSAAMPWMSATRPRSAASARRPSST